MTYIDATTIELPLGGVGAAAEAVAESLGKTESSGRLMGMLTPEIGDLNRLLLLRQFASGNDLLADREAQFLSGNPFGVAETATSLHCDAYRLFPFLEEADITASGPYFEVRTYQVKKSGLLPTIAAWERAVPQRVALSPLSFAAFAVTGRGPRFMHIWPYASLDERSEIRHRSVEEGVWPPEGGPQHLDSLASEIYLPLPGSPMQ